MRLSRLTALSALLLVAPAWAQQAAAPAPAAAAPQVPAIDKTKLSYAVGFQIGSNFLNNKMDVDLNQVIRGLQDAYARRAPAVPAPEMQGQLMALQARIRTQAMAAYQKLATDNLRKSEQFLAANKVKPGIVTLPDGIQYRVIEQGTGTVHPTLNSTVTLHYRASLMNGLEFDSSFARGKPVTFKVKDMIKGWQAILPRMVVGDRWQVYVPPQLAFGATGQPPRIGPNEALVFELKILDVKN